MSIHITPELVEATYDLLRLTKPFARWKLPLGEDVCFVVNGNMNTTGYYLWGAGKPCTIGISHNLIGTIDQLVYCVAHEMAHMREHLLLGREPRARHGRSFYRLAELICKYHRWDPKAF